MPLKSRKLPKPVVAALLIVVGIAGRLALVQAANVEPVLVISMLAGALLGGVYVLLVPVAIMSVSDALIYAKVYGTQYTPLSIVGLGLFVYSGYVFAAAMGGFLMRRRLLWRTKTVAVFTAISIPLTIAFDVWTAFGDWMFLGSRTGLTLPRVYEMQVPFTLIHILSSLLFAPILGMTFLALHLHGLPVPGTAEADLPARAPDE